MANNYQRLFYIFKDMDRDVGCPTGYIKVEINCEVAKLHISLSNLLSTSELRYKLYGIRKDLNQLIYTVICDIPTVNGKADVKINVDSRKIGSKGLSIEDLNVFAIIIQAPNKAPSIKCPLVAYTKGELSWRKELETLISNEGKNESQYHILKKDTFDNKKVDAVNKATFDSIEKANTIFTKNEISNLEQYNEAEQKQNMPDKIAVHGDSSCEKEASEAVANSSPLEKKYEQNSEEEVDIEVAEDAQKSEVEVAEYSHKNETEVAEYSQENTEAVEYTKYDKNELSKTDTESVEMLAKQGHSEEVFEIQGDMASQNATELPSNKKTDISSKFKAAITSIYDIEGSTALEQEKLPELTLGDDDILTSAEKNFNDISSIGTGSGKIKSGLDMSSLKEELDQTFENYSPFKMKSKRFKWWKINSPGLLNNILFRNNVKTYLLFNPKVMLAHYKYKYIIFGIRIDRYLGKEYFVCGVPGVYSIDENPFGSMGSWAQIEGYKPKYGAFGYWLILIDPRTGKLLKMK